MMELTQARLKELLHYEPDTGVFTWRAQTSNCAKVGEVAGCINWSGYRRIGVSGKLYRAHRLAWLYVHGAWPVDQLDHRNGARDDNRLCNLREATHAENQQNREIGKNNMSGMMGVSWHKRGHKWQAHIRIAGRQRHLGLFDTPESAHEAYLEAKAQLHEFNPIVRAA